MRKLILLLCLALPAFGTINGTMQWDVRTTGSNSNSGGFDPGVSSPGTDYSQQDSPQISYTDLVIGATTTQYTSVLHAVSSALPGNTIQITAGTGCTTGTYEILSNSTITATVDRSMGTAASVCTAVLGGGWLGPLCSGVQNSNQQCNAGLLSQPNSVLANGQTIWIKAGTYTTTVGIPNYPYNYQSPFVVTYAGYYATHGDITLACLAASTCTRPLITTSTSGINLFQTQNTTSFLYLEMSITAANSQAVISNYGMQSIGPLTINFCKIDGAAGVTGIYDQGAGSGDAQIRVLVEATEFNMSSTGYGIQNYNQYASNPIAVYWSWFHGAAAGIWDGNNGNSQKWIVIGNVFSGNTRGVYQQAANEYSLQLLGNSFYGQTSENVRIATGGLAWMHVANNVFWGGTYGVYTGGGSTNYMSAANAYGNQSTAAYSGWYASPASTPDVTLTASPFTNPGSGIFTLNNTSGGGAALKAAGFPGVTPMGTGYLDIGALQSQAAAGASIAAGGYVQ